MKVSRTAAVLWASSLLVVGGVSAVAVAAIPGTGGKISACYATKTGALRVIDLAKGQRCTSLEKPLAWNQQGPIGPVGPAGPEGPAGGVSAYIFAQSPYTPVVLEAGENHSYARFFAPSARYQAALNFTVSGVPGSSVTCSVGGGAEDPGLDDAETIQFTPASPSSERIRLVALLNSRASDQDAIRISCGASGGQVTISEMHGSITPIQEYLIGSPTPLPGD